MFRWLEQHAITRNQSRNDGPHGQSEGVVPGSDEADKTARHPLDARVLTWVAEWVQRDPLRAQPARVELPVCSQHLSDAEHLGEIRLCGRLTVVLTNHIGEMVSSIDDTLQDIAQHSNTFFEWPSSPLLLRAPATGDLR